MRAQSGKLRTDAAECALIRDLATDKNKRELFARLADHLSALAGEVERAISETGSKRPPRSAASGLKAFGFEKCGANAYRFTCARRT
jgi:hypothetical protein